MKKKYALDRARDEALAHLLRTLQEPVETGSLLYPPANIPGDLAFPCFPLAKSLKKSPALISSELKDSMHFDGKGLLRSAGSQGGYLNFHLNEQLFAAAVIQDFRAWGADYGKIDIGSGKKVIIDFSSPNIAKPFSIGHLRSTNIGSALYRILGWTGFEVLGDNHLGDWGTQFGKLIYAYTQWGDRSVIEKDPIHELLKLYVRFHKEAGTSEEGEGEKAANPLEDEARRYFKKLEEKDPEMVELWEWFREVSLQDFQKIYDILGISFDMMLGESFYNDKMEEVVRLAREKGMVEEDTEGTLLIRLDQYGITTPVLIQKKDGASLYATRDLACALYRIKEWNPDLMLYVVGEEQQLYFSQIFKILELMGYQTRCEHIHFGLIIMGQKMQTRKGNVIFLEDVINEAIREAAKILEGRELSPAKKEEIARVVGIGAIRYNDLSQNRKKSVTFDWEKMLSLDGNSSPYLQYSYTRARSILRKAPQKPDSFDPSKFSHPEEWMLIKKLSRFHEAVRDAATQFYPHLISNYLFECAQQFTSFYSNLPVLNAQDVGERENRLILLDCYSKVMKNGLALLGVDVMEEM
jgi:arginyl-tRNA synthetase